MRIPVPESKAGLFVFFGVLEAFSFFIICANTRALAQGSYLWTGVTDFFFTAQSFTVAKIMIDDEKARTWWAGLGMAVGGVLGSWLSIFVTKHVFGQ